MYTGMSRGLGVDAATKACELDLGVQDEHGVHYQQYRADEDQEAILSLFEAPNNEAGETVHRESHGLTAGEIDEVVEGE